MSIEYITQLLTTVSTFIVSATGFLIAIGTIVKPIRKWLVEQFTSKTVITERLGTIETKVDSAVTSVDHVSEQMKKDRDEQGVMKEALQAVVRNDLTEIYYRSAERGFVYENDRENFEKLYLVYTKLGGNSYIHSLHKLVIAMPNEITYKKPKAKKPATKRKPKGK